MTSLLVRAWHSIMLTGYVLRELTVNTAALLIALVNPRHRFRPRLVEVPLRCRTEREVAVLGMLVTLSSPRQVSVSIDTEQRSLLVYTLDARDAASARQEVFDVETRFLRAAGSPARFENPPEVSE